MHTLLWGHEQAWLAGFVGELVTKANFTIVHWGFLSFQRLIYVPYRRATGKPA